MHRLCPHKVPKPLKQLGPKLPVKVVDRAVRKLVSIVHLYNFHLRHEILLQNPEFFAVLFIKHLIGIGRINVITGCFFKSEIPCFRKIVTPGKIINPAGILSCNLLRAVCRSGIYNNHFIHQIADGRKAPVQHSFFIFDNHTQTDPNHGSLFSKKPIHRYIRVYFRCTAYRLYSS